MSIRSCPREVDLPGLVDSVPLLGAAFLEQQKAVRKIWQLGGDLLEGQTAPPEFLVALQELPDEFLTFERNIFSTFFATVLHLLDIPAERRAVYIALNHLFRVWVTSADNLLDAEDKETLCFSMPGRSRIIRQVVAIMLADRIMSVLFAEAVEQRAFERGELQLVARKSLSVLLPSAAEEGLEESGFDNDTDPEYILNTLHPLKTGILFQVPFLGPETIEADVDPTRLRSLKSAMMSFGIGCQILDDIRDMARDHIQRRANYAVALVLNEAGGQTGRQLLDKLTQADLDTRVYREFPDIVGRACNTAMAKLEEAMAGLQTNGLVGVSTAGTFLKTLLLRRLDLPDLADWFAARNSQGGR